MPGEKTQGPGREDRERAPSPLRGPAGHGRMEREKGGAAHDGILYPHRSVVRRWIAVDVACPYPLLESLRRQLAACGGAEEGVDWGADALLHALLPEERSQDFLDRVRERTAGAVIPAMLGERLRDAPLPR